MYSAEVLADSPVGYWRFEEGTGNPVVDHSGNGYTGSHNGTLGEGRIGDCLNGLLTVSNMPRTTDFTVEWWWRGVGGNSTSLAGPRLLPALSAFQVDRRDDTLGCRIDTPSQNNQAKILPFDVYDGEWWHFAIIIDGGTINWYVNGELELTDTYIGTIQTDQVGVVCGSSALGVFVDELAIYDQALTPERIAAHYRAGSPGWLGARRITGMAVGHRRVVDVAVGSNGL